MVIEVVCIQTPRIWTEKRRLEGCGVRSRSFALARVGRNFHCRSFSKERSATFLFFTSVFFLFYRHRVSFLGARRLRDRAPRRPRRRESIRPLFSESSFRRAWALFHDFLPRPGVTRGLGSTSSRCFYTSVAVRQLRFLLSPWSFSCFVSRKSKAILQQTASKHKSAGRRALTTGISSFQPRTQDSHSCNQDWCSREPA